MTPLTEIDLKSFVKDVLNFPKKGIVFKDITPLLADGRAFRAAVEGLAECGRRRGAEGVVSVESRGFLFGSAVAIAMGVGLVPVRKKGKLPRRTLFASYQLEYGADALEMHADALEKGRSVLIVDDVLATGGTAAAVGELVRRAGGEVAGYAFLIELMSLNGRARLGDAPVDALIRYP